MKFLQQGTGAFQINYRICHAFGHQPLASTTVATDPSRVGDGCGMFSLRKTVNVNVYSDLHQGFFRNSVG